MGLDEEIAADAARTATLEQMGYRVCRVTSEDVAHNMDGIFDWLLHELEKSA